MTDRERAKLAAEWLNENISYLRIEPFRDYWYRHCSIGMDGMRPRTDTDLIDEAERLGWSG
jgi:hypothetical protein